MSVRIRPIDFDQSSIKSDSFGWIELGGNRVVCHERQTGETNHNRRDSRRKPMPHGVPSFAGIIYLIDEISAR